MRAQGSDSPSAPGTGVPKLHRSRVWTVLSFPWGTWKFSIVAADVRPPHGQWANYSNALNSQAPGGSSAYFYRSLHLLLQRKEFVSEQAARTVNPTAFAPGTRGPQLLQNYPTATLKLPTGLARPLYPARKQPHSPLTPCL